MKTKNWPEGFTYGSELISLEMSSPLLRFCLSAEDPDTLQVNQVYPHLEIKEVSETHPLFGKSTSKGSLERGLFATQDIPQGTFIGEYMGEVHLIKNEEEIKSLFPKQACYDYAWLVSIKGLFLLINAKNISNEMTFSNSYQGIASKPNVQGVWHIYQGSYIFGYQTISTIEKGEEILTDYGDSFFKGEIKSI